MSVRKTICVALAWLAAFGASSTYAGECTRLANLHHDLGWTGGHKTRFCVKRGYDGMTNYPNSSYKAHGGGFCYVGDIEACNAKLQLCSSHEPITGRCLR